MKSMKRALSLLLVLALLMSNIPAVVFATGEVVAEVASGTLSRYFPEQTWVLTDDGTLTISGSGTMVNYDGKYSVAPWNAYKESITCIVIDKGFTTIGNYAFSGCTALTTVVIPDHVTEIGNGAYSNCTGLTTVVFHNGLTTIGSGAFSDCTGLTEITIPDGITYISGTFAGCTGLTSVELPNGLTYIGDATFSGCTGLAEITIPDGVTFIGWKAFKDCTGLTSVVLPDSMLSIGIYAFNACTNLSDVQLNNGLRKIGHGAFYESGVAQIEIPDTVEEIEAEAFRGCKNLKTVVMGDNISTLGERVFYGCSSLKSVDLPKGIECIDSSMFMGCSSLESVVIPDSVTEMGYGVFSGCKSLKEVTLPEGVTKIQTILFEDCTSLEKVNIPEGITKLGWGMFWNCSSLKEITIPSGVTEIAEQVFRNCTSLKTITFAGAAPVMAADCFDKVVADAFYSPDDESWTSDVMQNYGGTITWRSQSELNALPEPVITVKAKTSDGKPYMVWDKVEGAEKYFVYRSTKATSGFERIKSTTKTAHTDTTAKAGTKYYYKVKAIAANSDNNSDYSATKSCTVKLPQPEVSITGSSASGKPIVKWETVDGAAKYRVYRATSRNGDYKLIYTGVKARSYTDKTAKAGTTYYYKVKAVHSKSSADSALSDAVSRLCELAKPVVSITRKNGDPRLTWDKVDGAAKYYIYRATSKNGTYTRIKTTVSATSFTDTTAKAGKTYYYKVKAVHSNTDANSAYSSIKYITAK